MKSMLVFSSALLACAALCAACDGDDGGNDLTTDHPGWGDPGCFGNGCHDRDETHHSDLQPYECVECHGTNGSPEGHDGDPPCSDCHGQPHGNDGFPDPESCQTCH